MVEKEKTEIQALKELLAIRKARLEKETDPLIQEALRHWIKETEDQISMHTWAKLGSS